MKQFSQEAISIINTSFLQLQRGSSNLENLNVNLRQEQEQVQQSIQSVQVEILDGTQKIKNNYLDAEFTLYPSNIKQYLASVQDLLKVVHPLSEDLQNLQYAQTLLQLFTDFLICQYIDIEMNAEFDNIDKYFPPSFRYGLNNPYQRAQYLYLLRELQIFKQINHSAYNECALPEIPPRNSLLKLVYYEFCAINDFQEYHNKAISFIANQLSDLSNIDLYDTNDILEQQFIQLTSIHNGETSFSMPIFPKIHQYLGEFWKCAIYLNVKTLNFPMAAQTFQCLKAMNGESWKFKNLFFECIFESQFNDIQFDFQSLNLSQVPENNSYDFAISTIQNKIPELINYFDITKQKIISLLQLIDCLCNENELQQQFLEFAFQLILNKFLKIFVTPQSINNLQYFKALFIKLKNDIQKESIPRKKLKFICKKFGYPQFAPNGSICRQKTFLDQFSITLKRPQYDNYFIQQLKENLRKDNHDTIETIDLENDIIYQLGDFESFLTYSDFGLVNLDYDFYNYITNRLLNMQNSDLSADKLKQISQIKQQMLLEKKAEKVISDARKDYQSRMKQMITEIDAFTNKAQKFSKEVTELTIRSKYKNIPQEIISQIESVMKDIQRFLDATASNPILENDSDFHVPSNFELANYIGRKQIPSISSSLLFISDYNELQYEPISFGQPLINQYFNELKEFQFNGSFYLKKLSKKQINMTKLPWNNLNQNIEDQDDIFASKLYKLNVRQQQQEIHLDQQSLDSTILNISEKIYKKQLSLEEANLQLNSIVDQQIIITFENQQSLMHFNQYIDNNTSKVLVLDTLPICHTIKNAFQRVILLSNNQFKIQFKDFAIQQSLLVQTISHFMDQLCKQIKTKLQNSNNAITHVIIDVIGPYYDNFDSSPQELPQISPLLSPDDLTVNSKQLKQLILDAEKQYQVIVRAERQSNKNLLLLHYGLTHFGLPLGFCMHKTQQQFLQYDNGSSEMKTKIPFLDLLAKAKTAQFQLLQYLSQFSSTFSQISNLQKLIEDNIKQLFISIQYSLNQLYQLEKQLILAACRYIWSNIGPNAYNFRQQMIIQYQQYDINKESSSSQLLKDSTPAHAQLIIEMLNYASDVKDLQSSVFFQQLSRGFIRDLTKHITRLPLQNFEDILLLKAEIQYYERYIRYISQKCEVSAGSNAKEILISIQQCLSILQEIRKIFGSKKLDIDKNVDQQYQRALHIIWTHTWQLQQ